MAREVSPELLADPMRMLTAAECAQALGIGVGTWTSYVSRQQAPAADDPDADRPANRRTPRWRAFTVAQWQASRRARSKPTP